MPSAGSGLVSAYYRLYARYNMGAIADSVFGRGLMWTAGVAGKAAHSIGLAKDKPWFARTSMRSVKKIMPEAHARIPDQFPLPEGLRNISDLRVASILDRFSHLSFSFECQMMPLSTKDWKERMEEFKPHLLLVESAWEGLDESWKWKVSIISPELVELIVHCRRNGIPTVFWNKEDPKHFETFIRAAELFDVVFTTDVDKIPEYRDRMKGGRVYLLPFAAQPAIHNPLETFERSDAFCFAGSYYAKQMERNRTFSRMVRTLSELGKVEIFDRYMNTRDERLAFPERFSHLIVGTLEPTDIDRAYKGYYYGLNMNTVRSSQTMFSRRALELLASNTVVIGNYSKGLRNYLGDLTISTDDMDSMLELVGHLKGDIDLRDRYRLAGLRKVMSQHTYRHRLLEIVEKVYGARLGNGSPSVAVVSDPSDATELKNVLDSFRRQKYADRMLYLIGTPEGGCEDLDVHIIADGKDLRGDLVSYMCPEDSYGPHYLEDLVLSMQWSGCQVVGKGTYYQGRESEPMHPGKEFRLVDGLLWRRALISKGEAKDRLASLREDRDLVIRGAVDLSTDRFNYRQSSSEIDWSEEEPVHDQGLDVWDISRKLGRGQEGYISRHRTLRVFGRYSKASKVFRAPYLHLRNVQSPDADVVCSADETSYFDAEGVEVAALRTRDIARALRADFTAVQFHLVDRSMLRAYEMVDGKVPVEVWVYGPEAELALQGRESGTGKQQRMSTERQLKEDEWNALLKFPGARFVFASASLAKDMENLAGVSLAGRSTITPVLVDPVFEKAAARVRRGMLIAKPHWGAELDLDAAMDILEEMSSDPRFPDLPVTIYGDWSKGVTQSKDAKSFGNVRFVREVRSPRQRAELFASHELLLMPQIHDHNFATPLEAMSAGAVPVMNRVGAVAEFLDGRCGMVLTGEAKLDACFIWSLIEDRVRVERLSEGAVEKARLIRRRATSP